MGTEVLRPYALLSDRFPMTPEPTYRRRRNFPANGYLSDLVVYRKPSHHAGNKRVSPKAEKKRSNDNRKPSPAAASRKDESGPIMGQVTLLRRGESLTSFAAKSKGGNRQAKSPNREPTGDLAVCGTERIGPESPEMVPKQIRLSAPSDMYAGSACTLSPSPRSVPLPSFFNKMQQGETFDNSATKDLRRWLRLDC